MQKSTKRFAAIGSYLEVLRELGYFLWARRLWWLAPVVLALLLVAALAALASSTPAAPFIYTLF